MDKKSAKGYACPMQCEGDKVYQKPGDCPVCNMHLVPVEKEGKAIPVNQDTDKTIDEHNHNNHMHDPASNQQSKICFLPLFTIFLVYQ